MPMTVELLLDNTKYFVQLEYIVDQDGNLQYKCNLEGNTISTFPYRQDYIGNTQDEALKKIAKRLRQALNELMEC